MSKSTHPSKLTAEEFFARRSANADGSRMLKMLKNASRVKPVSGDEL